MWMKSENSAQSMIQQRFDTLSRAVPNVQVTSKTEQNLALSGFLSLREWKLQERWSITWMDLASTPHTMALWMYCLFKVPLGL